MRIAILHEREHDGGWTFDAEVFDRTTGAPMRFEMRMSWADYNLWSPDGTARPEAVAAAVLQFLFSREPCAEVATSFDAARVRRRHPDADEIIPTLIR